MAIYGLGEKPTFELLLEEPPDKQRQLHKWKFPELLLIG